MSSPSVGGVDHSARVDSQCTALCDGQKFETKCANFGRVGADTKEATLQRATCDQASPPLPPPADRLRAKATERCLTASAVQTGSISQPQTLTDTCSSSASAPAASLTR